jgi:uncharacterized protein (TIGR02588 family)
MGRDGVKVARRVVGQGRRVVAGAVEGAAAALREGDADRGDEEDRPAESDPAPDRAEQPKGRNAAEWVTLLVSLAIVVMTVALALYEHFWREEPPGTWLRVELDLAQAVKRDDLYYIPYTATNQGSAAAEAVGLLVTVRQGETVLEEVTTEIPFLANSGSADGVFVTAYDPATHTVEAQPTILQIP